MPIYIKNDTHWRTPDIERFVRTVADKAEIPSEHILNVEVIYNTRKVSYIKGKKSNRAIPVRYATFFYHPQGGYESSLTLKLPKIGPKVPHSNEMVAIAAAIAAPTDGVLLAPSETFRLANALTYDLYTENCEPEDREMVRTLGAAECTDLPPAWADASKFLICKVKDPKKDGTYLDFVAKKRRMLNRVEESIETETVRIADAQRRLDKALKRKQSIENSLNAALKRRS